VRRLENVETRLRRQDLVCADPGDREQMTPLRPQAPDPHATQARPRLVHLPELQREIGLARVDRGRTDLDVGVARVRRRASGTGAIEEVETLREELDDVPRRAVAVSALPQESLEELLRGAERGLDSIDVLDAGKHGEAARRVPEGFVLQGFEVVLLPTEPALAFDHGAKPLRLRLQERRLTGGAARFQHELLQPKQSR